MHDKLSRLKGASMAILTKSSGILSRDYGLDEPAASDAGIKRSTVGATVVAAVLAILTVFNGPFDAAFGSHASPWLKFAVFAVILIVWGVIMVADILARPAPKVTAPASHQAPPTDDQLHDFVRKIYEEMAAGNGGTKQPAGVGKTE
jgi:hypothetical protein